MNRIKEVREALNELGAKCDLASVFPEPSTNNQAA